MQAVSDLSRAVLPLVTSMESQSLIPKILVFRKSISGKNIEKLINESLKKLLNTNFRNE